MLLLDIDIHLNYSNSQTGFRMIYYTLPQLTNL